MSLKTKAAALFAEGKTTSAVARILGISLYKAGKLKPSPDVSMEPAAEPDTDRWEVGIKVPLAKAAEIFTRATEAEKMAAFEQLEDQQKMDCVLTILQVRMDALLAPPAVPIEPTTVERIEDKP